MKIKTYIKIILLAVTVLLAAQASAQRPSATPNTVTSPTTVAELKRQISELKVLVERAKSTGLRVGEKEVLKNRARAIALRIASLQSESVGGTAVSTRPVSTPVAQRPYGFFCYGLYLNLKPGSSGNDVIALREILNREGLGGELTSDGVYSEYFDSSLSEKVKSYQASNNIAQTGELDSTTRKALYERYHCPVSLLRFTVLHPNNTTIQAGTEIVFQWVGEGVRGVKYISLIPEDTNLEEVVVMNRGVQDFPITTNTYKWIVPVDIVPGKYKVKLNKVSVSAVSSGTVTVVNQNSIKKANPYAVNRNLYLTSNSADEIIKLKNNELTSVSWSAWVQHYLTVQWKNLETGNTYKIVTTGGNPGNNVYSFRVGQSLPSGKYKVQLVVGGRVLSESWVTYTITSDEVKAPVAEPPKVYEPVYTQTYTPTPTYTPTYTSTYTPAYTQTYTPTPTTAPAPSAAPTPTVSPIVSPSPSPQYSPSPSYTPYSSPAS